MKSYEGNKQSAVIQNKGPGINLVRWSRKCLWEMAFKLLSVGAKIQPTLYSPEGYLKLKPGGSKGVSHIKTCG